MIYFLPCVGCAFPFSVCIAVLVSRARFHCLQMKSATNKEEEYEDDRDSTGEEDGTSSGDGDSGSASDEDEEEDEEEPILKYQRLGGFLSSIVADAGDKNATSPKGQSVSCMYLHKKLAVLGNLRRNCLVRRSQLRESAASSNEGAQAANNLRVR